MSKIEDQKRIQKLRELINEYRYNYHVLDKSIYPESVADSLKKELSILEAKYPDLITSDSPTQRVAGQVLAGFKSVRHNQRMLSLNDVFSFQEIMSWYQKIKELSSVGKESELFLDIKMDGLACSLRYENNQLILGATRGDGFIGEDVTANIRTIEAIPLKLHQSKTFPKLNTTNLEVRGEIVMYKKDFEELNIKRQKEGLSLFANPRNTAAGTIRQLDPKLVAQRKLHFIAYDLITDQNIKTNAQIYQALSEIGFKVNNFYLVTSKFSEVQSFLDKWDKERESLPFNTDGVVIKLNSRELYNSLGVVGKAPKGAVAYKFSAEQASTQILDIIVSIGRTGLATPVAILRPVNIAGSLVQMATLHNQEEIAKKDIRIFDTVIVHKAGDIIPEVLEPLKQLRTGQERVYKLPEVCPICQTKLVKDKKEDVSWRCPNINCNSRVAKQVIHFASKAALDIEGLGQKNVQLLLDQGLISDQADIFNLKEQELLNLERFAEISSKKLIKNIQEKKQPLLRKFLYGLGIRHVGEQMANDLANYFKSLDRIKSATEDELLEVEGIGQIVATSIIEWFNNLDNLDLLNKFTKYGLKIKEQKLPTEGSKINGKKFVITGTLKSLKREEAADKIRALGGEFQSIVTKETDFLVVGENVGENKLKKAKELKTNILNEEELLALLT